MKFKIRRVVLFQRHFLRLFLWLSR